MDFIILSFSNFLLFKKDKMYRVYIIRGADSPPPGIPAISTAFTNALFVTPPIVIDEPPSKATATKTCIPSVVETCIGTDCGHVGCNDCDSTHQMIPITPDYEIFSQVYTDWENAGSTGGVVIVKSSTATLLNPTEVASLLTDANTYSSGNFEIFYYAKWLDRPDQFNVLHTYSNMSKMVRTWNPHGMQSIAFTEAGFIKLAERYPPNVNPVVCRPFAQVLNTLIQNGTMYAITTTPSSMQYDSTLITSSSYACQNENTSIAHSYLRSAECRGVNDVEHPINNRISSNISFFWFVIAVLMVAVTVWIIFKITGVGETSNPLGSKLNKLRLK